MSPRPYITSKTQSSISSFPSSSSAFRTQLRRQPRREPDSRSSEEVGLDTYQPKAAVQGYSWVLVGVGGASPDRPAPPGAPGPVLPSANRCRGITSVSSSPPTYRHITQQSIHSTPTCALRICSRYLPSELWRYHVTTKTMHAGAGRRKRSVTTCLSNACASQDFSEMRYEASGPSRIQGLCRLQITCSCFS